MAKYILNMGGNDGSQVISAVDLFKVTENGVEHITAHGLSLVVARAHIAAASCGNYILAMGGDSGGSGGTIYDAVDVFKATDNGVEAVPGHELTLSVARSVFAAASCGNYILAMGGERGGSVYSIVDVFKATENGVEAVQDHGLSLSVARLYLGAASAGNYILAMGGYTGRVFSNAVDVFKVTENGVEAVLNHGLTLSVARARIAAASCGNYILAMGGDSGGSTYYDTVDVFKVTANGVEKITDHGLSLSVARSTLSSASCGAYILAMGGIGGGSTYSNAVDVFKVTSSGVEHITDHGLSLSAPRHYLSSASCGEYVLAMGGISGGGSTYSNTVDVFQVL